MGELGGDDPPKIDLSNISDLASIGAGKKMLKNGLFWAYYPPNCQKHPNFDQKWPFLTFFFAFFHFFQCFFYTLKLKIHPWALSCHLTTFDILQVVKNENFLKKNVYRRQ